MEDFSLVNFIPQFGVFGALVFAGILAIMRGNLVPGKTHRDILKDRDYWRTVALTAVRQNDKLIIGTEAANSLLKSLPLPDEEGVG